MSSTKESDVVKLSESFPIFDLKEYDIAEKTIHFIQVKHASEKPKVKNDESEENWKKAEHNFMVDLKTLRHKTSVDPKLLQLKICVGNKQKEIAP